jgi:hypothetical protein
MNGSKTFKLKTETETKTHSFVLAAVAGEGNLILRSASHPPLILPVLRAYCSKKHIISGGLKLIKMAYLPPIMARNMDFSLLAESNGYI